VELHARLLDQSNPLTKKEFQGAGVSGAAQSIRWMPRASSRAKLLTVVVSPCYTQRHLLG